MENKIILSINAGSSSVKVSVYKARSKSEDPQELAVVEINGLTAPPTTFEYNRGPEKIKGKELSDIESQDDAFNYILKHLEEDEGLPELSDRDNTAYACHRVVHGGDYNTAKVLNEDTYEHIEKLSDLAPLHNASALAIIRSSRKAIPNTTNLAFFDTSFHSTLPASTRTYAISPTIASKNKLRKYGFHGLSYASILSSFSSHLNKAPSKTSFIALHLGSGASACAIGNGQSIDTSMGLTPLGGLPGATRSGDIDPSLVFHYTHSAGAPSRSATKDLHITQAEQILNKESGWKALASTTDFGHISANREIDEGCRIAFDLFVDRVAGYVGAYFVKLEGKVDGLVFAGGIGEKGIDLRKEVGKKLRCMGFDLDEERNKHADVSKQRVVEIGKKVFVCRTDEQLEMARGCVQRSWEMDKGYQFLSI